MANWKAKTDQIGGQEPNCPKCHGNNAMLHIRLRGWWAGEERWVDAVICRDCNLIITQESLEISHFESFAEYRRR